MLGLYLNSVLKDSLEVLREASLSIHTTTTTTTTKSFTTAAVVEINLLGKISFFSCSNLLFLHLFVSCFFL